MASNKANTLHPPQQFNSQPASGPMPVKAHIYHSLAELNAAFDTVISQFGHLKQINYFCSEPLTAMYHALLRIRAQANRELITVLGERETANANHFENLYGQSTCPLRKQTRSNSRSMGIAASGAHLTLRSPRPLRLIPSFGSLTTCSTSFACGCAA